MKKVNENLLPVIIIKSIINSHHIPARVHISFFLFHTLFIICSFIQFSIHQNVNIWHGNESTDRESRYMSNCSSTCHIVLVFHVEYFKCIATGILKPVFFFHFDRMLYRIVCAHLLIIK